MPVTPTTTVNVRYMVADVEAAVAWYTKHLGFTVISNAAPAFADSLAGVTAAVDQRSRKLSRETDARWCSARTGRLEPNSPYRRRSPRRGHTVACRGSTVPQRYCDRAGRLANSVERSVWESCGALPAISSLTATELVETPGQSTLCGGSEQPASTLAVKLCPASKVPTEL